MQNITRSESRYYNQIISQIDEVYHEIALKQGFSDSAMGVLYVLADHDGTCPLPELIRQSGLNKQTINSALRKLEGEELVYLEPTDRRCKCVCLTPKGKDTVRDTVERVLAVERRIYGSWAKEEWELYIRLTERYLRQLREEMEEILK